MPITNYDLYMGKGFEGQIATAEPHLIRGSFEELVNGETVRLPFGRAVRRHSDGKIRALATGSTVSWGITVATSYEKSESGEDGIPPGQIVSLLRTGTIWMIAEVAINHLTDSVFFRFDAQTTPGLYDAIGRVRNDANNDGSANAVAAPTGCRFLSSAAAGEPVAVYVNFGG